MTVHVSYIRRIFSEIEAMFSCQTDIPRICPEHVFEILMGSIDSRIYNCDNYLIVFGGLVLCPGAARVCRVRFTCLPSTRTDIIAGCINSLRRIGLIVITVQLVIQRVFIALRLCIGIGLCRSNTAICGQLFYHGLCIELIRSYKSYRKIFVKGNAVLYDEIITKALSDYCHL